MVEADVHYPTEINLLFDAMRKVITLSAQLCEDCGFTDWRQHAYNVRHAKRHMRTTQNKKGSKAKSPEQQEKNAALIVQAHRQYLDVAQQYLSKARQTLVQLQSAGFADVLHVARQLEIEGFMSMRIVKSTRLSAASSRVK